MNAKKPKAQKRPKAPKKPEPEDLIPPDGACKNCGTTLTGAYCNQCGQRADEPRRVVIGLVQDFLVDTLAIDGKLARSIALLFWRPGRLARRYLNGKRVNYSPPFRLYLFASVFFFLFAFALIGTPSGIEKPIDTDARTEEVITEIESEDPETAAKLRALREAQEKPAQEEPSEESDGDAAVEKRGSGIKREWDALDYEGPDWLEPHARKMYEAAQRAFEDPRLFFAQSKENLTRVMLLAPVVYALILVLLYVYRRKFYIYDHFVVSLYMHAALYAYLLVALLLSRIPVVGVWLAAIPLIWGWLQPFAVFRQAYGSNWVSVFMKWTISIAVYFSLLALIITLGFSVSLYQS